MAESVWQRRVSAVRRFNRFYTRRIGVLQEGYLASPFGLAEVRVLYELAHREEATAGDLARELGLDPGYLSRILRGFGRRGFVAAESSQADRRRRLLRLTPAGRDAFAPLQERSRAEIGGLLGRLPAPDQERVVAAMATIERLLDPPSQPTAPYLLRPPGPGDMGWVVARHGALYAHEYGWDERFEGLVAGIVAAFVAGQDTRRERCWIAERDGEPVGSVFLVEESERVAKLRLLLVEPRARGLGIGARLVAECVRFARAAGYERVTLWTNDVLHTTRRLYERAGFRLVASEPHRSFGRDLVGETWSLALNPVTPDA